MNTNMKNSLEQDIITWGKKGFNEAIKQAAFVKDLSKINFFDPLDCDDETKTQIRINVMNINHDQRIKND